MKILNSVLDSKDKNKVVIFYGFPTGETNSQRFALTTKFSDILKWGEDRQKWIEANILEREKALKELKEQIDGYNNIGLE